jgi:hypothetical protein
MTIHTAALFASVFALSAGFLSLPLLAAEDGIYSGESITDVRLEGIRAPTSTEWSSNLGSGGSVTIDGTEDVDRAYRFALSSSSRRDAPISLVAGGDIAYTRLEEDRSGDNDTFQSLTADLRVGAAVAFGRLVHVEATPFIGAGIGKGDIGGETSDLGFVWEYGIQGGVFLTVSKTQLGLIGGWIHSEWDLEFPNGGSLGPNSINLDVTHEGTFIGLAFGGSL